MTQSPSNSPRIHSHWSWAFWIWRQASLVQRTTRPRRPDCPTTVVSLPSLTVPESLATRCASSRKFIARYPRSGHFAEAHDRVGILRGEARGQQATARVRALVVDDLLGV